MLSKNTKKTCVLIFLMSVLVAFVACGIHGNPDAIDRPTIRVTSYTGSDEVIDPNEEEPTPFQQTIYWAGESKRGVVVGYAFRVLEVDGKTPVSTPGNIDIDLGELTPENLLSKLGDGWVLHYEKGADKSIPLSDPSAARTIWTDGVYTTINFPANVDGVLANVPSMFQVVAIDNYGQISDPATRHFYSKSMEPDLIISSSAGVLMDKPIGQGIRAVFVKKDAVLDDVITIRPWYFEYQLLKVNLPTGQIGGKTPDADLGTWLEEEELWEEFLAMEGVIISQSEIFNTMWQEKINEVIFTASTSPALETDFEGTSKKSASVIVANVIDLAGVRSNSVYSLFYVDDRYKPHALFYQRHSYAYHENHHYVLSQNIGGHSDIWPSSFTNEGTKFAHPFTAAPVFDEDGNFTSQFEWSIVGDARTRFWFRWGYHGEFEKDNPNDTWRGIVRDKDFPETAGSHGENYFTEIQYYHLQLNGDRYPFMPLLQDPSIVHPPGWLRVPANHEISQRLSFSNLTDTNGINGGNMHEFVIKVEDLQGVVSEPVSFRFRITAPFTNTQANNDKILYICNLVTPQQAIFNHYREIMPQNMQVTYVNRQTVASVFDSDVEYNLRNSGHIFPYGLLAQYKYVFYTIDNANPNAVLNMAADQDGFRLYMRNQGNVIIVGNQSLSGQIVAQRGTDMERFYTEFFGWDPNTVSVRTLETNTGPAGSNYFFKGATPNVSGFPILSPELEANPDPLVAIRVRERRALALISYFDYQAPTAEVIYSFDCKFVSEDDWSPQNNEERDRYQGKAVGIRKRNGNGIGYTFTFPLYHIQKEHARALLAEILR